MIHDTEALVGERSKITPNMSLGLAESDMDLAQQLAKYKEENLRLTEEKNNIMREFNTRMKHHLEEVRLLKEVNERLQTELEDLRDLCCYLDDDRVKCRTMAKEWQNFGRYISSILHTKESSYQQEVNSLSLQQETIITENINLKRLCHELENNTNGFMQSRPREYVCIRCSQRISLERDLNGVVRRNQNGLPTASIINQREKRGTDVESTLSSANGSILSQDSYNEGSITEHKNGRKKKVSFLEPDGVHESENKVKHEPLDINSNEMKENRGILRNGVRKNNTINGRSSTSSNDSTSSVHDVNKAMQVLEIHSQLEEKDHESKEPLKDKEVAVLKEMCNVVWRKLSNDDPRSNSAVAKHRTSKRNDDEIVYEDLL